MKHHRLIIALAAAACLWAGGSAFADMWKYSEAEAITAAQEQGKRIFFLAVKSSGCKACSATKNEIETEGPLRTLIEQCFIPWLADTLTSAGNQAFWKYTPPAATGIFVPSVPLICVFDPNDSDGFLYRKVGIPADFQKLYDALFELSPPKYLADTITAFHAQLRIPTPDMSISDINGDQKIGLAEAIYFIQIAAGLRKIGNVGEWGDEYVEP